MTNKPMLSVERELLELLMRSLNGGADTLTGTEHMRAYRELRAILDEPECDPNLGIELMRGAGSGLLIQDHGNGWQAVTFNRGVRVSSFPLKGGYKEAVAALDAAQHQGEPVAICRLWNEGGSGERTSVEFIKEPCADGALLYAEQPAPVAVVMPERETYTKYLVGVIPHNANEVNAYKDGWNTCLEEVSRLNGVKP